MLAVAVRGVGRSARFVVARERRIVILLYTVRVNQEYTYLFLIGFFCSHDICIEWFLEKSVFGAIRRSGGDHSM